MPLPEISQFLSKHNADYLLLNSKDTFLGEYAQENMKFLAEATGFTGSNGIALIAANNGGQSHLFTDGRYTLQAEKQLPKNFTIHNIRKSDLSSFLTKSKDLKILFFTETFSYYEITNLNKSCHGKNITLSPISYTEIFQTNTKVKPLKIWEHDIKYSGKSTKDKLSEFTKILKQNNLDGYFISDPESVCWLLNIRGNSLEYTPIVNCFALITTKNTIDIFGFFEKENHSIQDVKTSFHSIKKIEDIGKNIKNSDLIIGFDANSISYCIHEAIIDKFTLTNIQNPITILKSRKNKTEISGAIQAHIIDGAALTTFLYEISTTPLAKLSGTNEYDLAMRLKSYRKQFGKKEYISESFPAIVGLDDNGAIIHYKPEDSSAKKITHKSKFLLIDSGGQYHYGTTDITRTISLQNPHAKYKDIFTAVLKGHIAIATAIFPEGTCGYQLDTLARQYLWEMGLDYGHGTGHGVGSCLSVHEGPQSISTSPIRIKLEEGMVVSNEPGCYLPGEMGIRIENLVLVKKHNKKPGFLCFENLTLAPLDYNLVNFSMITPRELEYLISYQKSIIKNLESYIDKETLNWLKKEEKYLKSFKS